MSSVFRVFSPVHEVPSSLKAVSTKSIVHIFLLPSIIFGTSATCHFFLHFKALGTISDVALQFSVLTHSKMKGKVVGGRTEAKDRIKGRGDHRE